MKQLVKRLIPAALWNKARLLKMRHIVQNYPVRDVRHTYGGIPLTVHLADGLGEGWYDRDWPEPSEITHLKQHALKPGATVFDLGAHQCVVALMLAEAVRPGGKVVALEAEAHNAAVGKINAALNNASHLTVLHAAAAENSGTITFNESLNGSVDDGSGKWGVVEVPAWSVDDLAREYGVPDVLFVDVEGFECRVLRGAAHTLRQTPDLFVEVHAGVGLETFGGSPAEVVGFFSPSQYDLFLSTADDQPLRPLLPGATLPTSRFFLVAIGKKEKAV